MKNVFAIGLVCLFLPSLAAGQQGPKAGTVEAQVKEREQNWAQATVKEGASAVDQYEAEDIIDTDPSGRATNKAQDKMDLSSGDLKF